MLKKLKIKLIKLKYLFKQGLDTMLFLIALILIDVNSFHFGTVVGTYVVAATLILVAWIISTPGDK